MKLNTEKMIAEKSDGIGWITFNNPARRNAMSLEMWEGIDVILEDFEKDESVHVVVMKGAGGKAFVSGADISEFKEKRNNAEAAAYYASVSEGARARLAHLAKPLIAMIDGFCLGGGLAVALAADMRFASEQSQFGVPAARLGIAYGFDGLRRLVSLVGPAMANEIMFTATRINAEEAARIGLINRVLPPEELEAHTRAYCDTLADNAPLSIKAHKIILAELSKENADQSKIDAVAEMCFNSADYKEGRTAFMEKRKPVWKSA